MIDFLVERYNGQVFFVINENELRKWILRVGVDLSEPLVHFFVLELGETEARGSSMICLGFLGQSAEELRRAVVFGPQAFPSAPCCLHH